MSKHASSRKYSLDVVRCIALICVIGVHFFLNTGFYDEIVAGPRMYIMTLMRNGFMICVPLFMVLTGYLQNKKRLEKAYFFKIEKVLSIYLLASILCGLFRVFYQQGEFSLKLAFVGLFDFSTANYAWYIEMYIGLYLLTPFLNILYHNLETKEHKKWLLVVLILLTALPGVVNVHRLFDLGWWLSPAGADNYYALIPDWWDGIYPLTYYFIGCYLSEYPVEIKPRTNLILIVINWALFGSFNFYRSYGTQFVDGKWQGYGSLLILVQTVLVFNFVACMDFSNIKNSTKSLLVKVSDSCLGAYLVSYIFDKLIYDVLNQHISSPQEKLPFFFATVPIIVVLSLITSIGMNMFYIRAKKMVLYLGKRMVNGKCRSV